MNLIKMLRSPLALAFFTVCCVYLSFAQTSITPSSPEQTSPTAASPTAGSPTQSSPGQGSPSQSAPGQPELQFSTRDAASEQASATASSFDQVVDRMVEREHFFMAQMKQ